MIRLKSILAGCFFLLSLLQVGAVSSFCELKSGWKFQRVSKDVSSWHPGEAYTIKAKTDLQAEELKNRLLYNNINKFLY